MVKGWNEHYQRMVSLDISILKDSKSLISKRKMRILEYDNYKCVYCLKNYDLTIDHINTNFIKRGVSTYTIDSCQTLCVKCHQRKNEDPLRWVVNIQPIIDVHRIKRHDKRMKKMANSI